MTEVTSEVTFEIDPDEIVADAECTVIEIMENNLSALIDGADIPHMVYTALSKIDIVGVLVEQRAALKERLSDETRSVRTQLKDLTERFNELTAERDAIKAERNGLLREAAERKG